MRIEQSVLDEVIAHARQEAPAECCGVLLGVKGQITLAVPARNMANPVEAARRFLLDPRDHFAARRLARQQNLSVLGFYHSHPHGPAGPSASDIAETEYPELVTLIVSLNGETAEARLFRVEPPGAEEIPLEVG